MDLQCYLGSATHSFPRYSILSEVILFVTSLIDMSFLSTFSYRCINHSPLNISRDFPSSFHRQASPLSFHVFLAILRNIFISGQLRAHFMNSNPTSSTHKNTFDLTEVL